MNENKKDLLNSYSFGDDFPDSRLVEEPDGKRFQLREAILMVKRLGRPLTEDELSRFEMPAN